MRTRPLYLNNVLLKLLFLMLLIIMTMQPKEIFAQGAAINESGAAADPSAILDVSSTDKGMLVPRMTEVERDAIQLPAIGLLIFNTTTNCFNFWNGLSWKQSCFDCPFNTPYVGNNSPICEGNDLYLNASALPGAVYTWTGPNGFTSNLQNPVITGASPSESGPYTLTATLNNCTSSPVTTFVTVNSRPTLPIISSNTPLCDGDSLKLSVASVPGGIYNWAGPNGFTSTIQNPSIANAVSLNSGVYSVTVTANGCVSEAGNETVNIYPIPSSPVAGSNSPVCEGSSLSLTASLIPGAVYSWTGPNGFTSSDQNPTITNVTTSDAGTYEVTAYVNGCANVPSPVPVIVNTASSGSSVFVNTGADQSFVVPLCVNTISVKVWGAGGGGFNTDKGGGAGFSKADITVTPGETLKIVVGTGGRGICNGECSGQSCAAVYGGGGGTYEGNGGGGMSGVFRLTSPIIIAGGGGGGGGGNKTSPAGAGGGTTGFASPDVTYGGKGGTQLAGGAGGATTVTPNPGSGSYLLGGNSNLGGAGGGGYYGGGGGGRAGGWLHRGGGGGSGYISSIGTSNTQILSGSNEVPANISDPDYVSGIGYGGTSGHGGNGYIVISW